MPIASPEPSQSSLSWSAALAVASVLLVAGGALVWDYRDVSEPDPASGPGRPPRMIRELPMPIADDVPTAESGPTPVAAARVAARMGPAPFSVEFGVEHGTRVVKIRVTPEGDELIVDAATGRLLETRPSRSSVPPAAGKFAAPFVPST
ncbi:MAG TPA: hypothetical protein VKD90_17470 [Gemmataceae bacterium]|nr:hypothetical protein [Gemmataceae bacterium]